jgi:hypothetical protein
MKQEKSRASQRLTVDHQRSPEINRDQRGDEVNTLGG